MAVAMVPDAGRPNPITFEIRSVENRAESQKAGHYVGHDVIYVKVHQPGQTAQVFEDTAENWLDRKRQQRDPHYDYYASAFEAFKRSEELPISGAALKNWPNISPTFLKVCQSNKVMSVEDLAEASETTLKRLGPGARAYKKKAEAWLAVAESTGQITEQLADLEERLRASIERQEQLEEDNRKMAAELAARDRQEAKAPRKAAKADSEDD